MDERSQAIANCVIRYDAGTEIIREGETSEDVFELTEGRVEVVRRLPSDETVVLAELGPGDVFGEMGLIDRRPRSATIRAITPVEVIRLDREGFLAVLAHDPKVVLPIFSALFQRMRTMNNRLIELELALGAVHRLEIVKEESGVVDKSPPPPPRIPKGGIMIEGLTDPARHVLDEHPMVIDVFPFRIGRRKKERSLLDFFGGNDLDLADVPPYDVSTGHCAILKRGDSILVADRGARLGTVIDDEIMVGSKGELEAELEPGTHTLRLGSKESPYVFRVVVPPRE